MASDALHCMSIRKHLYIPLDIECALSILDCYRNNELVRKAKFQKDIKTLVEIGQKKVGIDKLEDYIIDHAFEAPVKVLIQDYVYLMNVWYAQSPVGTELAKLYENMRDAADDVVKYFL